MMHIPAHKNVTHPAGQVQRTPTPLGQARHSPQMPRLLGDYANLADFSARDHGSIVFLAPLTQGARQWLTDNVQCEPWQWLGGALCIDRRPAADLLAGIADAGFSILRAGAPYSDDVSDEIGD